MGGKWGALIVLSAAQFLMVLDQSVMNVSISQLVADFDTTVTTIQAVITLYALVMAALMLTGGKLGDLFGRRRVFVIGLVIYGVGSALTAASWSVPTLTLGWSVLEGIGAAMVLPALVALAAGTYSGRDRATVYGVLGGVAGAGIAVGPILGGWLTTNLTWRLVFAGEVVLVIAILVFARLLREPAREGERPALDWVGSVLSALGLSLIVFGVLQASNWGWLEPRDSPVEPFGFALTPFVIAAGGLCCGAFELGAPPRGGGQGAAGALPIARHSDPPRRPGHAPGAEPDPDGGLLRRAPVPADRAGLRRVRDGVQMLPVSITMLLTAASGSALASRWAPRTIVRAGLAVLLLAVVMLLATIDPEIDTTSFAIAMGVLGVGLGLIASQLGNVVQSAIADPDRSEAGGLQYTAQQLGSSLGTALIGAIVITGLLTAFTGNVADNPAISDEVAQEVGIRVQGDVSFVESDQVRGAATEEGLDEPTVDALVEDYEDAQLQALKTGLLIAGLIVVASFAGTRRLPTSRFGEQPIEASPPGAAAT